MAKRRMTGEDVLKEIFNDKDSDEDDLELDLGVDELEVIDGDECNSEQSDVDAEIDDEGLQFTSCPSTPGLCVEKGCFALYHTKLDYTAG